MEFGLSQAVRHGEWMRKLTFIGTSCIPRQQDGLVTRADMTWHHNADAVDSEYDALLVGSHRSLGLRSGRATAIIAVPSTSDVFPTVVAPRDERVLGRSLRDPRTGPQRSRDTEPAVALKRWRNVLGPSVASSFEADDFEFQKASAKQARNRFTRWP